MQIVVINNDPVLKGKFSELFMIKSGNNSSDFNFSKIVSTNNKSQALIISDQVKNLQISPSSNRRLIASYSDNSNNKTNNKVPFAVEKRSVMLIENPIISESG